MTLPRFSRPRGLRPLDIAASLLCMGVVAVAAAACMPAADQESFVAENDVAMQKMMSGMSVQPTGDVDRDFAAMMIPHHQGAIDMAVAELRHGSNEQLRRLAQEIIVSQQQEIAVMRMAVDQAPPSSSPAPTQICSAVQEPQEAHEHHSHH